MTTLSVLLLVQEFLLPLWHCSVTSTMYLIEIHTVVLSLTSFILLRSTRLTALRSSHNLTLTVRLRLFL
nr:MAG TPA: hypothetical protein [Caudoviricetes sp.]